MNKKRWFIAGAALVVTCPPLFTSWIPLPSLFPTPERVYSGNADLLHSTGRGTPYGWEVFYRHHRPGYLATGLRRGADVLAKGTYRYDFYFSLRAGHLASLLSNANDVVRIEAVHAQDGKTLLSRTYQMADFKIASKELLRKSVTFSISDPSPQRVEPRVYWQGLCGIFLQRVELIPLGTASSSDLMQKTADLEAMMQTIFLDRGFVVIRDRGQSLVDVGDTAMWTGLYVAAEALRYKATQDPEARRRMEKSLWAMHSLITAAPLPGSLVRSIDSDGNALKEAASKDAYTGFFYGLAQAMPYIQNPALKRGLSKDVESLGNHLLDHDLSFVSPYGSPLDLNPYLSPAFWQDALRDLQASPRLRNDLMKTLRYARWYFWLHGQRPPASFTRMIAALNRPESLETNRELVPFVNDVRGALRTFQRNVHRSALRGAYENLSDTPYAKLDLILLRALKNLDNDTEGKPFTSIEQLKILPSQSLHALHFLKVAAELLPKPNRFDRYYLANLYAGKALLRTTVQWHQIDEDALTAILGQTETDTRRTASSHLSFLALHDLIELEKDPLLRFQYQKLFEAQYEPMRSDGNAMIDAMEASVGLSDKETGLAFWSLSRYPIDRTGKGELYWMENRDSLLAAFGGEVNGQARDPLPPDLRPRDAFLWQRSAHSIRGDHEGWLYPPLDYLFAYWLARTAQARQLPDR